MGIINAIDGCGGVEIGYGAPELVTGGRDGCVRLWDIRVKEPVLALEPGMCCIFFHAYAYTHIYSPPALPPRFTATQGGGSSYQKKERTREK